MVLPKNGHRRQRAGGKKSFFARYRTTLKRARRAETKEDGQEEGEAQASPKSTCAAKTLMVGDKTVRKIRRGRLGRGEVPPKGTYEKESDK